MVMSRRVEILGGGPAGLYVARLLKLRDPSAQVIVHERMAGPRETFGFGVGLTGATMRNLQHADPESAERVACVSKAGHDLVLRFGGNEVRLHGARNLAIGRATLLSVLADAAVEAGVDYRPGSRADIASIDADVVVAADGIRSSTRAKLSAELGVHTTTGRSRFVWCGTEFAVPSAFFSATRQGDGLFVMHAYPYAEDRSTFLVEIDDTTWASAGLAEFDAATAVGETDAGSIRLLESLLTEQLGGRGLLTNRTRWSRFTNLRLDRWHHGNVVLIGDAAHTAHYTLGSGTKLALEDAIALADALAGETSPRDAFAAYESARRPPVERFKKLADRSERWWDSFRARANWSPERLGLSYMTRSGNLTMRDYAEAEPDVAHAALSWLGDAAISPEAIDDWVLAQPLVGTSFELPRRIVDRAELFAATPVEEVWWSEPDVWGEAADALVKRTAANPSVPLLISGDTGGDGEVWPAVDLAERIRITTDRVVGVRLGEQRSIGATSVGAGRADFVVTE
jgi:anthraniloyl-CoA monooxygenase